MSRITAASELSRDELEDAPEGQWIDTMLEKDNQLGRQVVANINQNLPILNSPTSQLSDPLTMVHGVPLTIKNPLNTPIRSVMAVACIGLSVDSTGKPTRGTYSLGLPQLEWHQSGKQDGSVVVTAVFPAPMAIVSVRRATPKPTIANTTFTAIDFDTSEQAVGSGASWSSGANTRITIASAGQYDVTATLGWNTGAGGSIRRTSIRKNNVSMQEVDVAPGYSGMSLVWSAAMSASDYLELFVYQDSGGPLNTNSINRLQVKCVAAAVGTTGRVTLFFAGGE